MSLYKLNLLSISEYNLLANKNPNGSYDRITREHLYGIIGKLAAHAGELSSLEKRLQEKFSDARFSPLEEKDKKVKLEVTRYRLSNNVKQSIKMTAALTAVLLFAGAVVYQFVLDGASQRRVEMALYAELNKLGLVSRENFERIKHDLTATTRELAITKKGNRELSRVVERMILNNKVTENLKYIVKRIYADPQTKYVRDHGQVVLKYNHREIARYTSDPALWYLVGIVDKGLTRIYYDNEEILEIETIFGRQGEETPIGEYQIKNKVHKPTWYKKEKIGGKIRVRAIPFGDPEHDIGHWWMGLRKLGKPVPGSYGIHGVNPGKVNEFFKKNFDWRNGSAGCPNIQDWYLDFLARVLPLGTRVNIVARDKWVKPRPGAQTAAVSGREL